MDFSARYSILLLTTCLAIAVFTDLKSNRIPNWLIVLTVAAGLTINIMERSYIGLAHSLGGILVGLIFFLPFYIKSGMGAGDVKLMASVGSFLGLPNTLIAVGYTLFFGGILAGFVLLMNGAALQFLQRYYLITKNFIGTGIVHHIKANDDDPAKKRFPYALAIFVGTAASILTVAELDNLLRIFSNESG